MNENNCSFNFNRSYDVVVDFKYKSSDFFTKRLIDYYFYYFIENNKNNEENKFDDFMYLYTTDRKFFNYVQNSLIKIEHDSENYYYDLLEEVLKIYDNYNKVFIGDINKSVWI